MFCDLKKLENSFKNKFFGIKFIDIKYLDSFLRKVKNKNVLIDPKTCSLFFENILKKENSIKYSDPISILKSIKFKNEIKNIIKSHIFDGAALTKFYSGLIKITKKKELLKLMLKKSY